MTRRWTHRSLAIGAVIALIAAAALVWSGSVVAGAFGHRQHHRRPTPPAFDAAFEHLDQDVRAAQPPLPPAIRFGLIVEGGHIRDRADRGRVCDAVDELGRLTFGLAALEHGHDWSHRWQISPAEVVVLNTDLAAIRAALLSDPRAARCGGTTVPPVKAPTPVTTVSSSDNTHLTLHIALPAVQFGTKTGDGTTYTSISEPGTGDVSGLLGDPAGAASPDGQSGAIGRPDLPGFGEQIAVPEGQTVSVAVTNETGYQLPAVQLWPLQPSGAAASGQVGTSPVGNGPAPLGLAPTPPFTIDQGAYASRAAYPPQLAGASAVGSTHGLSTATIGFAGAQYTPATGLLRVLTSEDVTITFSGDSTNTFGDGSIVSPRTQPFDTVWANQLINYRTIPSYLGALLNPQLCGEDMIIVTSSALSGAATTFAADRTLHGVDTRVITTDGQGGVGTTPTAIRNAIAKLYHQRGCPFSPSYVMLVGDTSQVPTFEISLGEHYDSSTGTMQPNFYEDPVATDMPYGFIHQAAQVDAGDITDFGQDLFVGRLPASSYSQASTELNRISYQEDNPPASTSPFYSNVVGAEFFQPCAIQTGCLDSQGHSDASTQDTASFLRSSEFVGTEASIAGKTFDRVAADESNYDTVPINPQTFDNGTPIPSGINWKGDAADIANYVNNGAFLLWHSDHGAGNGLGWYEPPFNENDNGTNDFSLLNGTLGQLPVIWSSDCDSGVYDNPNFTFASGKVSPAFGVASMELDRAVAFVGASRESPIYEDGFMLQGMGSSLFPEEGNLLLAFFGVSPRPAVATLGPLLDAAKNYMVAESGVDLGTDVGAQGTLLEYNDFGDPSMTILRDAPSRFDLSQLSVAQTGVNSVLVESFQGGLDGTVVDLVRNNAFIGQGVLENGEVSVTSVATLTSLQGVTVVLTKPGYQPLSLSQLPWNP